MSPIEEHVIRRLSADLAAAGVMDARVTVYLAEAENWRYRVDAGGRTFELWFNHRDLLVCRELTPGSEKNFVSSETPRTQLSGDARRLAVRLIGAAVANPAYAAKEPPVL